MKITEIHVQNFKSFDKALFKLNDLNVILGANASGKTNFISILRFLKDVYQHGIENAIALQGGQKFLTNTRLNIEKDLVIKIIVIPSSGEIISKKDDLQLAIEVEKFEYELRLTFNDKEEYSFKETVLQNVKFIVLKEKDSQNVSKSDEYGNGKIKYSLINGKKLQEEFTPKNLNDYYFFDENLTDLLQNRAGEIFESMVLSKNMKFLILQNPILFRGAVYDFSRFIGKLNIYYIDSKESKKSVQIIGKKTLEEDGSNLALVLQRILNSEKGKKKLTRHIRQLLPFIEDIYVEQQLDNSLFFKVQETYQDDPEYSLPSLLLSDGTISITAIIIAMFFEKEDILCLEEPERNIHPQLLSGLIQIMKSVSKSKQIIVTTHNTEFVRNVDLEDIIFIRRDSNGFSRVILPEHSEIVKTFLENDIGMDEIFLQNLFIDN